MKKIVLIIFVLITCCSCSTTKTSSSVYNKSTNSVNKACVYIKDNFFYLFNISPCSGYVSNENAFRVSANYSCEDKDFALEKSVSIAKDEISREIDSYIVNKWGHSLFLSNPNYEIYVEELKNEALDEANVVCSKLLLKNNRYDSYISLELSTNSIDDNLLKKFGLKGN